MISSELHPVGTVKITITDGDGLLVKEITVQNQVLKKGRAMLAALLGNQTDGSLGFISRMLFGSGGTSGGTLKSISAERNGLFSQVFSKGVISNIDPLDPTQVVFTAILGAGDANGTINEMALQLGTGDLYSMATFGDINKTSQMQITFNWNISFV